MSVGALPPIPGALPPIPGTGTPRPLPPVPKPAVEAPRQTANAPFVSRGPDLSMPTPGTSQAATPPPQQDAAGAGGLKRSLSKIQFCPGAMELIDESVTLFVRLPKYLLAIYYLGALPFCVGVIYFWHDCRKSLDGSTIAPEALFLTASYILMKVSQAIFCRLMYCHLSGEEDDSWTVYRVMNIAVIQTVYASTFWIVYPSALVLTVPFPWVNSFYHNVSLVGTRANSTLRSVYKEAALLSLAWPGKTSLAILYQSIVMLIVWANLMALSFFVPYMLKTFLNIDTVFTDSPEQVFSGTFTVIVMTICFLVMNPINKTYHVLRCFNAEARKSGVDLMAGLRHVKRRASVGVAVLVIALTLMANPARAASADDDTDDPSQDTPRHPAKVVLTEDGKKTKEALDKVLAENDYQWRAKQAKVDTKPSMLQNFLEALDRAWKGFWDWVDKLFKKKEEQEPTIKPSEINDLSSMLEWIRLAMILVLVAAAAVVAVAIMRWRRSKRVRSLPQATIVPLVPVDLTKEDVKADDLPEDSWLKMARELEARGDLRLAMRALYLATLSAMAQREWIRIGRGKSNRDYLMEFRKRLRTKEGPVAHFADSMELFEASWYGTHPATSDVIDKIEKNHENVRAHVGT